MRASVLVLVLLACGSKKDRSPEATPATPAGSAPAPTAPVVDPAPAPVVLPAEKATPTTGAALPEACAEYRTTIESLSKCSDALPASTREALRANFAREWADWDRAPDDTKASLAAACKRASDDVKTATASACSW